VAELSSMMAKRLSEVPPAGLKLLDRSKPQSSAAPSNKPKQDRNAMFSKRDKDKDGKLTKEEFLKDQPDPAEAPKRWIKFDKNNDASLSREEFVGAGK
jgi:iduronate 2-sulfatase